MATLIPTNERLIYQGNDQVPQFPDLAPMPDGRLVLAWYNTDEHATTSYGVRATFLLNDGVPTGGLPYTFLPINTTLSSDVFSPKAAGLAGGGVAFAWDSPGSIGGEFDVRARVFDTTGAPLGNDFRVNSITNFDHTLGDITAMPDGRFLVVWNSDEVNGPDPELIRGRFFNADGTPNDPDGAGPLTNTEFQIYAHGAGSINAAALADGHFVTAFTIDNTDVYARVMNGDGTAFDPDGAGPKTGNAFLVPADSSGEELGSTVAALPGNEFVVAYVEAGVHSDVHARIFAEDGTPLSPDFQVNTQSFGTAGDISIVPLPDGKFQMVWTAGYETYDTNIFTRVFNADGTPFDPDGAGPATSAEYIVNTSETGVQLHPTAALAPGGNVVVVWPSLDDGTHANNVLVEQVLDQSPQLNQLPHLIGTMDADTGPTAIHGTNAAEVLEGLGGNDQMFGGGDDDVLISGSGDDLLDGGPGGDWLDGSASFNTDTASYQDATGPVRAGLTDPLTNTGDAAGDKYLFIDNLIGTSFADSLVGDNNNNTITGGDGNDRIAGYGDTDVLLGGAGNDALFGQGGHDVLDGGAGDDTLSGGLKGSDTFVFETGGGHDTVTDFEDGKDLFDVSATGLGFSDFTVTQQGADTLISFDGGADTILVQHTLASQITSHDFIFA